MKKWLVAVFLFASPPVQADDTSRVLTTKSLWELCDGTPSSNDFCGVFIAGYLSGVSTSGVYERELGKGEGGLCLPDHFTAAEARAIFVQRIRELQNTPIWEPMSKSEAGANLWVLLRSKFHCPPIK